MRFDEATAVVPVGEGRFTADVPDGWQQGRGAFGGVVVGLLARACVHDEDPARSLRTLSAELPAPLVPGPATITVSALRRGSGTTALAARLEQDGVVCAHATAVLGAARPVDLAWEPAPPTRPAWDDAAPIPERALPPPFARFFEYRPTGPLPFSGGTDPVVEGWVRLRTPVPTDAALLVALADAYWPTTFSVSTTPRPTATVTFGLHLTAAARAPIEGPVFYRARGVTVGDGFLYEARELWSAAGRLLALNPQTFAIIR